MFSNSFLSPTLEETKLIENLKAEFSKLSLGKTEKCSPAEKIWKENSSRLYHEILSGDPRNFLRWNVITETMYASNDPFVEIEFDHLRKLQEWQERWKTAIKETSAGHPIPFFLYPKSSGNLIHQAYHLCKFEEKTRIKINTFNLIFEFGGGYGSMCRLFHNLGFKGKYIILDLPQFAALQRFYLKSTGLPVHTGESFGSACSGVICISNINDLKAAIESSTGNQNCLFIATWSMSEAPIGVRDSILEFIRGFDSYLIAYQNYFHEIDNNEYFKMVRNKLNGDITWQDIEIEHLPGNSYLFGS
ncbi:MAG: hypothetical protein JRD69_07165 [Deltaproteobacteria bacterium]|nr:hypothetical protein [Deltaproteobacteria bacterium]